MDAHGQVAVDSTITLFSRRQFKAFLASEEEMKSSQAKKRSRSSLNSLTLDEQVALAIKLSLGEGSN